MLELQNQQGGNILLDRYGTHTYVAQGLYKYYSIIREAKKLKSHNRSCKMIQLMYLH